jgi:hypothetical protein
MSLIVCPSALEAAVEQTKASLLYNKVWPCGAWTLNTTIAGTSLWDTLSPRTHLVREEH